MMGSAFPSCPSHGWDPPGWFVPASQGDGKTWVQSSSRKGTRTKGPLAWMDRRGPKRRQQRPTRDDGRWGKVVPSTQDGWTGNGTRIRSGKKGFPSLVGAFKMILAPPQGCICLDGVEWMGNYPLPNHGQASTMSTKQGFSLTAHASKGSNQCTHVPLSSFTGRTSMQNTAAR